MESDDVSVLAQQIKQSDALSKEEAKLLRGLKITLVHPVLPQHEIETRAGSRPPTHEEIKKFESFITRKEGIYHPSEDNQIISNWKLFCKLHKWDPSRVQQFLLLREDNRTHIRSKVQRRKFVQFLAHGLPNRTLYSIYHRFKIIYANYLHRRFRSEEDEMIINHLEHNPNLNEKRKYADLARVLQRSRSSIWRRYKLLEKKRGKRK